MAISDTISSMKSNLSAAYAQAADKGGTLPEQKNLFNLADTIASITTSGGEYDIPEFDGGLYGAIAYLDKNGEVAYYTATSATDLAMTPSSYTSLVHNSADNVIYASDVLAYSFGSTITTTKTYFLRNCVNLRKIYGGENLTSIGQYFAAYCFQLNCPLSFPNVTSVGNDFLYNCTAFDSPVEFSDNLTDIGTFFLGGCLSFAQPVTLPDNLETVGDSFMTSTPRFLGPLVTGTQAPTFAATDYNTLAVASSNVPSYTQGVTVTGPTAQAWIDKFPNGATSTGLYRKLVLS